MSGDITELKRYSSIVNDQSGNANDAICQTSETVATLINQLIFSVDVIEKLTGFVNRQKAVNKVIPDELVTVLNTATTDANSAVALTLTALQSCYASVSSADEAKSVSDLELSQAIDLENLLMGEGVTEAQQEKQFARIDAALQNVEDALNKLTAVQDQAQQRFSTLQTAKQEYANAEKMLKEAQKNNVNVTDHQQLVISARKVMNDSQKAYQQTQSKLVDITLQVEQAIAALNQITENQ